MRRWILPLLCFGLAVAALVAALVVESSSADADPVAEGPPAASATTPVLSARRLPLLLLRPVGSALLQLGLQSVLEQSPPDTCLVVTEGGNTLLAANPDLPVVPASNQKLLVAHGVLSELGPDARFRTVVAAGASPVDGVVDGDLWLIGGGDPVLATDDFLDGFEEEPTHTDFEALADRIVEAGITTVTGNVVGDDSRYDDVHRVPDWPERDYEGFDPGPLDALLVNRGFSYYGTDPDTVIIPELSSDPSGLAAERLVDLLRERGVVVEGGPASDAAPADLVEVTAVESPPMHEIVALMLVESDNTLPELLVKELGYQRVDDGSTAAGLEVLGQSLADDGITVDGLVLADGSGLHDRNRLTCGVLVEVLDMAGPTSYLANGLPVAAQNGTLADRFAGTLVADNLRAKTGSLNESTALSGFITTVPGLDVTFAYIANQPDLPDEVVDLQDTLAAVLLRYPEGPAIADVVPEPVSG